MFAESSGASRHRIAAGLPVRVAVLLVAGTVTTGCQTTIQHGLDEREANRIVVALRRAGIPAVKVKDGRRGRKFAIEVPRGQASRAIAVLRERELPRRAKPGFAAIYGKSSLVPTPTEQRARYLHALAGEISRTLEAADGVIEARVHIVTPRRDPLALREHKPSPPRASVLLRTRPGAKSLSAGEVRRLVAGSVQDLEPARVAVIIHSAPAARPTARRPPLAQVGPIAVSRDSKTTLQVLLGGGLLVILLLGGVLAWTARRMLKLRESAQATTTATTAPSKRDGSA